MVPLRLCFIAFQMLTLTYTTQSLVMLTANSEDFKNIARKFLSESLSNKIAEFIAKSSDKMIETFSEDNALNDSHQNKDNSRSGEVTTTRTITKEDRFGEKYDKYEHRQRAVQLKRKPARTTRHWIEPIENQQVFKNLQENDNRIEAKKQDVLRIRPSDNNKYNKKSNITAESYRPDNVKQFNRDLIEADSHFHKTKKVKVHKKKLEPIVEETDVNENEQSDGDTRENQSKDNQYTPENRNFLYKVSTAKTKMDNDDETKPASLATETKDTKVESQVTDQPQTLKKRPRVRKQHMKAKKRYQKASLRVKEPKKKIPQDYFKKDSEQIIPKRYFKRQPGPIMPNPNWSEEPEPLENKQLHESGKSKHSYLRDQLKLRQYPNHKLYYPMKPKIIPKIETNDKNQLNIDDVNHKDVAKQYSSTSAKLISPENSTNKPKFYSPDKETLKISKSLAENKEFIQSSKQIVAHFLTTKNPTPLDENVSFPKQTKPDITEHSTESEETNITTAKEETFVSTRSTVYHGLNKNKDIMALHDDKDSVYHALNKNDKMAAQSEKSTAYHRFEDKKDIASLYKKDSFYHGLKKKEDMTWQGGKDSPYHELRDEKEFGSHTERTHKAVVATSGDLKLSHRQNERDNEELWKKIEKEMRETKKLRIF